MRMTIILASLCFFLISCATLTDGIKTGEASSSEAAPEVASTDNTAAPSLNAAPAASSDQAYASQEMSDPGDAKMEVQAAEHQEVQASALNEQRSTSELDAAAPEASATDTFYAGGQQPAPEVEQVVPEAQVPSVLPQKQAASWSQHSNVGATYYEEPRQEKPTYKKSKKSVKRTAKIAKQDKKKIAKNSKKAKREIASYSKKSHKSIAKKSKVDCKKIAKNLKKSAKREIAMCKAEKKKVAQRSHKIGKVAKAGCQCDYR